MRAHGWRSAAKFRNAGHRPVCIGFSVHERSNSRCEPSAPRVGLRHPCGHTHGDKRTKSNILNILEHAKETSSLGLLNAAGSGERRLHRTEPTIAPLPDGSDRGMEMRTAAHLRKGPSHSNAWITIADMNRGS